MANPGLGFRTVNSVLCEVSLHTLEPIVNTSFTSNIATGVQVAPVTSTVAMYVGALLVVDLYGTNQEIVTITAVNPGVSFTANFGKTHASGALVLSPTFPTQQPTDPIFSQSEMLGYLARAQNEFLVRVPCIFQLFQQLVTFGQLYQSTPATAIEINRVALSNPNVAITSLTRTNNVVTAVTSSPHGLVDSTGGAEPSELSVFSTTASPLTDSTFAGAFQVSQVVNPTTFTYVQVAVNSSSTGGVVGLWTRLYEVSQEELNMSDRNWRSENQLVPTKWYEDRTGNYKWGLGSVPTSNFPIELLCSVRDTDTLALTDSFLLPDLVLHFIKYKTLEYAWTKDGVQNNPTMAKYCNQRFEMGVVAVQRWMDGMVNAAATQGRRR